MTCLLILAEVSERDKSFVRMVSGPEATEWWNQEDADRYPVYSEVISFIHQRVYQVRSPFFSLLEIVINLFKFWKDDQLQRLPVSYIDRIEHLLNLWYASALSDDEPGEEAGLSRGTENTAATGALDSGDVEMATDPTEQSNTDDKSDPLMGLALHLNLISSENPLLSAEDRQDLALLDQLTQTHTQVEQVLGLETEMAATEQWNFEAVVQLIDLATNLADIPFTGKTQVHDQDPSSVASVSAPMGLASKGKGRLEEGPKKTSLTELLFQSVRREGSAGSNGDGLFSCRIQFADFQEVNPLPPMPLGSEVQDVNRRLSDKFPEFFGPNADHHCKYREKLFHLVAADLQRSSTQKVAGLSSVVILFGFFVIRVFH